MIACTTTAWTHTTAVPITIERALVVRVDKYELPYLALVLESELHPGEEADLREVDIECECWGYYIPAKLCGPPEDCYPEEGEFEVQSAIAPDYPDVPFVLTESEEDDLAQQCDSTGCCDGPDYDPEYDDYPEYNYDGIGA
jgi:hypothetical protein